MPTVYFQLERSKTFSDGTHPIVLVVKHKEDGKEKRYRHYTGRSASDKHWTGKGSLKRVSARAAGAGITNGRLEVLRQGADGIITNLKNLRIPFTLAGFKVRFENEVLCRPVNSGKPLKKGLFEYFDSFLESKRNIFQDATIKTYQSLKKSLQDYQHHSDIKLEFSSFDDSFERQYRKYLIEETGVIDNTVAKRFATLKAFLAEMKKLKVNPYLDYEHFQASRNYNTTLMYLTEDELNRMKNVKLTDPTLIHVRDVFCFACHTGIRFSDWSRLSKANLVSLRHHLAVVEVLKFTMYKVQREVTIPLDDYAKSIIRKYSSDSEMLFPTYTNQESNRSLKQIAKLAKLDDVLIESKRSGAKRIEYKHPKHEILSCHDARNTMATLYLEKGGRPEVLQQLLGHSDIKQTMRYVKITQQAVVVDHLKIEKGGKVIHFQVAQ